MNALEIPFARLGLRFVKKLTVSGIIGNTHGVSNARKPPRNASKKVVHKLFGSSSCVTPPHSVSKTLRSFIFLCTYEFSKKYSTKCRVPFSNRFWFRETSLCIFQKQTDDTHVSWSSKA